MSRSCASGLSDRKQRNSPFFQAFRQRVFMRVLGVAALFLAFGVPNQQASAGGGTLTVAMTAGDIPVTTGNPDRNRMSRPAICATRLPGTAGLGALEMATNGASALAEIRADEP